MFSNLDNTIYRWIFVIPPHIYVTRILLPLQSYFKYYVIWDGKQHIREAVSSSGWKDIEIEECSSFPDAHSGQSAAHTWNKVKYNFWGQCYATCSSCGVIKATIPTNIICPFINKN